MQKNNGRKHRRELTEDEREQVKDQYIKRGGIKGTVTDLANDWDVTRGVIHRIISNTAKAHKLDEKIKQKENEIEEKDTEVRGLIEKIDTYDERVQLFAVIKMMDIVPLARKVKNNITITESERTRLRRGINILESLMKGIDDMHKVDIHFHSTKILNVIQNLDDDTARILFPEFKRMLCSTCPLYLDHQKGG